MGCFYASIPIVGGWYVMQWAISRSVEEIGERGEKLDVARLSGNGDRTVIDGVEQKVGAGGRYGGVNLAKSDENTQKNNRQMLEAMFRKERRMRRQKDLEQKDDGERSGREGR